MRSSTAGDSVTEARRFPCIEAVGQVGAVAEAGAPQNTRGDRAFDRRLRNAQQASAQFRSYVSAGCTMRIHRVIERAVDREIADPRARSLINRSTCLPCRVAAP